MRNTHKRYRLTKKFCTAYCAFFIYCLTFLTTVMLVSGHSYLIEPTPDWRSRFRPHCRRGGPINDSTDDCAGPCIQESSWFFNKRAPVSLWRRGEIRTAKWNRNNHERGFIRLTLVPRSERMKDDAHSENAFKYSCFESHKRSCNTSTMVCGTDVYTYETNFTVPCVPDGDYVFGWSWYGAYATDGFGNVSYHFGDYWSCAYVRVHGGVPVKSECKHPFPTFSSGTDINQCKALSNRPGLCQVEPCPYAYGNAKPNLFCPEMMVKVGSECIPYIREVKETLDGFKKDLSDDNQVDDDDDGDDESISYLNNRKKLFASCEEYKIPTRKTAIITEFYISGLNQNGHLNFVAGICDDVEIPVQYFKNGLTFICVIEGSYDGVRFIVNDTFVRHEYFEPYAISGNVGPKFGKFLPHVMHSPINFTVQVLNSNKTVIESQSLNITFTNDPDFKNKTS